MPMTKVFPLRIDQDVVCGEINAEVQRSSLEGVEVVSDGHL